MESATVKRDTLDERAHMRPGAREGPGSDDAMGARASDRLVLVVDDSASAVMLYRAIVAAMGCDVAQAASLVDAIRWLREGRRPELIVLSDQAASVGPIDAARAVRAIEAFCGSPVIVVSKPLRLDAFTALARSRLGAAGAPAASPTASVMPAHATPTPSGRRSP